MHSSRLLMLVFRPENVAENGEVGVRGWSQGGLDSSLIVAGWVPGGAAQTVIDSRDGLGRERRAGYLLKSLPVTTRHVSRAMSSSSSVGITQSSTRDPLVSMRPSRPTSALLRESSISIPSQSMPGRRDGAHPANSRQYPRQRSRRRRRSSRRDTSRGVFYPIAENVDCQSAAVPRSFLRPQLSITAVSPDSQQPDCLLSIRCRGRADSCPPSLTQNPGSPDRDLLIACP